MLYDSKLYVFFFRCLGERERLIEIERDRDRYTENIIQFKNLWEREGNSGRKILEKERDQDKYRERITKYI